MGFLGFRPKGFGLRVKHLGRNPLRRLLPYLVTCRLSGIHQHKTRSVAALNFVDQKPLKPWSTPTPYIQPQKALPTHGVEWGTFNITVGYLSFIPM